MKGPEVHFPIMVESADLEARKRMNSKVENITAEKEPEEDDKKEPEKEAETEEPS